MASLHSAHCGTMFSATGVNVYSIAVNMNKEFVLIRYPCLGLHMPQVSYGSLLWGIFRELTPLWWHCTVFQPRPCPATVTHQLYLPTMSWIFRTSMCLALTMITHWHPTRPLFTISSTTWAGMLCSGISRWVIRDYIQKTWSECVKTGRQGPDSI